MPGRISELEAGAKKKPAEAGFFLTERMVQF
jgi:hypothetical protein